VSIVWGMLAFGGALVAHYTGWRLEMHARLLKLQSYRHPDEEIWMAAMARACRWAGWGLLATAGMLIVLGLAGH
jgi:hypothetical protein